MPMGTCQNEQKKNPDKKTCLKKIKLTVGSSVGVTVGSSVGDFVGLVDGASVIGSSVGLRVGLIVMGLVDGDNAKLLIASPSGSSKSTEIKPTSQVV